MHVLESIALARTYVEGVDFRRFGESQQLQDAVIRRIEMIGEAVKNLPAEMRDAAPGVPWRRIAGMRDKVVHDYMGVDIELVWTVVHRDLPELALAVRGLLEQQRGDKGPVRQGGAPAAGTRQASASKSENQDDMRLSALREYVEALGGRLEVRVRFSDRDVRLDPVPLRVR